jgi:hypothetical protein
LPARRYVSQNSHQHRLKKSLEAMHKADNPLAAAQII